MLTRDHINYGNMIWFENKTYIIGDIVKDKDGNDLAFVALRHEVVEQSDVVNNTNPNRKYIGSAGAFGDKLLAQDSFVRSMVGVENYPDLEIVSWFPFKPRMKIRLDEKFYEELGICRTQEKTE